MRINGAGNIVWSKLYGGTYSERGQVIKKAVDGGYILAGYAQSIDFDVSGNHGYQDIWVVKIDDAGHCNGKNVMEMHTGNSLQT